MFEINITTGHPAIQANFTANFTSGPAPLTVQFNDISAGNPTSWVWNFGDGTKSTDQHPIYTYTAAGNYTIDLTVAIANETATRTKMDFITVTMAEHPIVQPFPNPSGGYFLPPTDPNGDGLYEDLDGNGWIGFNDVVVYFNNLDAIDSGLHGQVTLFDFDGNGWAGFNDIVLLYEMIV